MKRETYINKLLQIVEQKIDIPVQIYSDDVYMLIFKIKDVGLYRIQTTGFWSDDEIECNIEACRLNNGMLCVNYLS